jgi:hypothetical protein
VRVIPSHFINIYEWGRDTPHPSLLPLMLTRKDLFVGLLASEFSYKKRRALPTAPLVYPHDTAAHTTNDPGGCNARRK